MKLKASWYIERLDRNRTIWSSTFYQLYITKIYFRQKIVWQSGWLNEALQEKNYSTPAHFRCLCKYWCITEYTSLFKRLLTINKIRSERKPSCYQHSWNIFWAKNTKCKRVWSDREWNHIDSSRFDKRNMNSYLLCNAMCLLIVKDTTNETETFLKTVKWNA